MEHLAGQTDAQWHKLQEQREEIERLTAALAEKDALIKMVIDYREIRDWKAFCNKYNFKIEGGQLFDQVTSKLKQALSQQGSEVK